MAVFSDQFDRWPIVKLISSLSGSKLVTKIGFHTRLAMAGSMTEKSAAALCRLVEAHAAEHLEGARLRDEFGKFRFIYQAIERGFRTGDGFTFGVRPEKVCAAIVFWKLADSQDSTGVERETQLSFAVDFLTLGIWLSTQYQTSDKEAKDLSRRLNIEKLEASIEAKKVRWKDHDQLVAYAKSESQKRVWDSVAHAASVIFPRVKKAFPGVTFEYGQDAVARWIEKEAPTVRRLRRSK